MPELVGLASNEKTRQDLAQLLLELDRLRDLNGLGARLIHPGRATAEFSQVGPAREWRSVSQNGRLTPGLGERRPTETWRVAEWGTTGSA